nr:multidrug resistance efflux transporter family protein [Weissella cibaria]
MPNHTTLLSTFTVALSSGVIATVLFFQATAMAARNMEVLATVEATQSFEVIFTVLLGVLFLNHALPTHIQLLGLLVMILGIVGINLTRKRRY